MGRIKDYLFSTGLSVGIAGSVMGGVALGLRSCGEEVYKGKVNEMEVAYDEGRMNIKYGNDMNVMRIKDGSNNYTLQDIFNENTIQQPVECFKGDTLERAIIVGEDGKQEFSAKEKYDESLDDQHIKNVFDRMNRLYNNMRVKVRNELQKERKTFANSIPSLEDEGGNE